jgi:FkbM family methyltransferase
MAYSFPLLSTLLRHKFHYFTQLPYNLNWFIQLRGPERDFLRDHPLVVTDVGCRGDAPSELTPLFPYMDYHAFDADARECERLNQLPHPFARRETFPLFIGETPGPVDFNLFHEPGQSSPYVPEARFRDLFAGPNFGAERQVRLEATTLADHYAGGGHPAPEFIKLDTQGSELGILRGAGALLESVAMVEVEVEFVEMYQGQPLFDQVLAFMFGQGFELLYLNRIFGQKEQVYRGPSRGQVIFGDALFGRREDRLERFSPERVAKYALLLINYGHMDWAFDLLTRHPEAQALIPGIMDRFKGGRAPRILRQLSNRLDQFLVWILHCRKFNHLTFESDRSWPIR